MSRTQGLAICGPLSCNLYIIFHSVDDILRRAFEEGVNVFGDAGEQSLPRLRSLPADVRR